MLEGPFSPEAPFVQGTLHVSIATLDGYVTRDTGLVVSYDKENHHFTIPFGDTVTAEECIRIVHQGLKRATGLGTTQSFPDSTTL